MFANVYSDDSLFIYQQDQRYGYINDNGVIQIEPLYYLAQEFLPCGIAAVVDDSGWVYIDKTGRNIIRPFIFDNGPDYFSEGFARYEDDGKMGFFNACGDVVIKARFFYAKPFSEELSAVCMGGMKVAEGEHWKIEDGKWGFINKSGEIIIEIIYDQADSFTNGTARVSKNGQKFRIDREGNVLNESIRRSGTQMEASDN